MMLNLVSARIHIPLLCTFLLLHGCGGGGGSSGSKPSTTSKAASSFAPVPSSVPVSSAAVASAPASSASSETISESAISQSAASLSVASQSSVSPSLSSSSSSLATGLTLNGQVANEELAGGTLVFTAGTQRFTTTLTAGQKYQVMLELEARNKSVPITAIAKGVINNTWIEFANVLPSAETLSSLAGGDNVLDENEFSGLNITALTTAEYAEIKNNSWPLTSDAEYKQALSNLYPVRAFEQAAMLTRLLSNVSFGLPANKQTTLDYLLDANVAEAHLETLRIAKKSELNKNINDLQSAIFKVSAPNLVGDFALESRYSNYLLTLNADGTGNLKTDSINTDILSGGDVPKVNANITWVRNQSRLTLNFIDSVIYWTTNVVDLDGVMHYCNDTLTPQYELCDLRFNSIELDLVTASDIRYIAAMKLVVSATRENNGNNVYQGAIESQVVRLINLDNGANVTASDLAGAEWISKNYSFTFSADGKVMQRNFLNKTTQTLTWTLTGSLLKIGGINIWIGARNEAGFNTFLSGNNRVHRDALVKRTTVSMTEADWVGRWSFSPGDVSNNPYDVNTDKTWRDGLEAKSQGSWARVDSHRQTAIANASWRMERDVLAIYNDKYYLSICQGIEFTPFNPQSCSLSIQSKSADFSSAAFWNSWSNPVFQEKNSGGIWMTVWDRLVTSSTTTDNLYGYKFYKVSENILYLPGQNSFIEMTSASKDEIELCEYQVNQSCSPWNKRTYIQGVEVKLTIGKGGIVRHSLNVFEPLSNPTDIVRNVDKVMMAPRNRAFSLEISPDTGRSISSASGCNGTLVGNVYRIPALTEGCEVVVNF